MEQVIANASTTTQNDTQADVIVTVQINTAKKLSDDAVGRIFAKIRLEAERFSQIAAVDVDDQGVAAREAERIAKLPANRSHVFVAAGTKGENDPDAVIVAQGSVVVNGRKMTAAKGAR